MDYNKRCEQKENINNFEFNKQIKCEDDELLRNAVKEALNCDLKSNENQSTDSENAHFCVNSNAIYSTNGRKSNELMSNSMSNNNKIAKNLNNINTNTNNDKNIGKEYNNIFSSYLCLFLLLNIFIIIINNRFKSF